MNYVIMKNGNSIIGLFQGMFDNNIITFNPGWNENGENLNDFNDVREIQKSLQKDNIELIQTVEENTSGPGSLMLKAPDGNTILLDQHR